MCPLRCIYLAPAVVLYKRAVYHGSSEAVWTERKCKSMYFQTSICVYWFSIIKRKKEHACILSYMSWLTHFAVYWMLITVRLPKTKLPALLLVEWVGVQGGNMAGVCWIAMHANHASPTQLVSFVKATSTPLVWSRLNFHLIFFCTHCNGLGLLHSQCPGLPVSNLAVSGGMGPEAR